MNGEAFQIARIVTAFKTGNKFEFTDYEKEIHFSFLPKGIIAKSDLWVSEPDKWLDIFPDVGIEKIYLIMDTRTNSKIRSTLGFSNSQPVIIMSVYKNGRVTYWKPHWDYSDTIKGWTVEYTENKWHNAGFTGEWLYQFGKARWSKNGGLRQRSTPYPCPLGAS